MHTYFQRRQIYCGGPDPATIGSGAFDSMGHVTRPLPARRYSALSPL